MTFSYIEIMILHGTCFQENLLSILSTVLVPSEADSEVYSRKVISGVAYGSAMVGEKLLLFTKTDEEYEYLM